MLLVDLIEQIASVSLLKAVIVHMKEGQSVATNLTLYNDTTLVAIAPSEWNADVGDDKTGGPIESWVSMIEGPTNEYAQISDESTDDDMTSDPFYKNPASSNLRTYLRIGLTQ